MGQKPYHGGNLWTAWEKFGLAPEAFLDYSANINPLGPSPKVKQALLGSLDIIDRYPEPEALELRAALAAYLGIAKENLLLGNGAAELIYLLGRYFDPLRIVLPAPTFGEYGAGASNPRLLKVNLPKEQDFQLDLPTLAAEIQAGDLVFIGNPNNPTGILTSRELLRELCGISQERGAILIIDEAFMDFVEASQTVINWVEEFPNLIVIGSLTKFFAIPGLRLGYLAAGAGLVNRLDQLLPPWRINSPAQAAGLASLKDDEYIQKTRLLIREEREFLARGLKDLGFQTFPAAANFMLVNGSPVGLTAGELQDYLGPKGILIRLCASFSNLDQFFFRIAVRGREDNRSLLSFLLKAVSGWERD